MSPRFLPNYTFLLWNDARLFIHSLISLNDCKQKAVVADVCVFLSRTEEPAMAGTCALDRHALQQLALNVHVKHSDLT